MSKLASVQRYIIMPKFGFEAPSLLNAMLKPTPHSVKLSARAKATSAPTMRVLDSIGEKGPKLVEMSAEGELSLRLSNPELTIVPEVFYHRQWYRASLDRRISAKRPAARTARKTAAKASGAKAKAGGVAIMIVDANTGAPLRGVYAVLFTEFATKTGDGGTSGAGGTINLRLSSNQAIERAYVYGPPGYWGFYATKTTPAKLKTIKLTKIDLAAPSLLLRQIYRQTPLGAGAGVVVAVIDTGVDGSHPALGNVVGGLNCVTAETRGNPMAEKNWGPAKTEGEHGTHVAGIIGGNGGGNGFRGVAPGVKIRSYRVFPDVGGGASNYDIAKAIDAATADGCHLINMSLGGGPADPLSKAAIDRALDAGVVVVAAAGNDGRKPVSFPAAYPECVSISAMGRKKSFPAQSIGASDVMPPTGGPGGADFVADFSNFGRQIDATGPGVEIVSTLPKGEYGSMSGTSMATPAVTGFAASLLASNPSILGANGQDRSQRLKDLLYSSCKPEGFGRDYEGFGLPQP